MSWQLPTPPNSQPGRVASVARLLAASLGAREMANLGLNRQIRLESPGLGFPQKKIMKATSSYKKKGVRKDEKKVATVGAVRRMFKARTELKQLHQAPGFSAGMAANTVYSYNVTGNIIQGDNDGQRTGDQVHLESISGKVTYITGVDSGFYFMRFIVLYSGEEYTTSANFVTAGLAALEVFQNGGAGFANTGTNPKACQVLHDELIQINSQIDLTEDGYTNDFYVNLKGAKFDYQSLASIYGKTKNLYLLVVADSSASGTTLKGTPLVNFSLKFRDP